MTAQRRTTAAACVASAALTVLSSAIVAAVTLAATPGAGATPAAAPGGRFLATTQSDPVPVVLTFPAPAAPAPKPAPKPVTASRTRVATPADPTCQGPGWQARRGEAAIARLRRPSDARAVPVAFRPARSDVLGMAELHSRRVDVFVRSCAAESDGLLLHVLAHELGHLLDATWMTDDLRARWMELRGIPAGTPWFGCDRCADFATPAGDFAEAYAQWQRGATSNRSQLAPAPSAAELAELAAAFFRPL